MGKRTQSPSKPRDRKLNTGSPSTCPACGGTGTTTPKVGDPRARAILCQNCGGTGKLAAGKVLMVAGSVQCPQPLTEPRAVFRALLSRDFRVKGGVVVFPTGITATLEVAVSSLAEVAGKLELRMVALERLTALVVENLYRPLQEARETAALEPGPDFDKWWECLKHTAGY